MGPDAAILHHYGLGHCQTARKVTPSFFRIPPERIKHFVQNTLGCTCPEEVFRSIEFREQVALNSFIVLDSAIIIGNRLLVYVAEAGSAGCVEEHMPVLVAAGRKEGDEKGLNRFRLVLVSDIPDEVRQIAEQQFEKLRVSDERVHLHVIKESYGPFIAEDAEENQEGRKAREQEAYLSF